MKPVRIIVFARLPLPGYCKTRLIPALGAAGAAQLAQRMLVHTLRQALAADTGKVELCVTPDQAQAGWHKLELPAGLHWSDQGEGDLGERMARAAQRGLQAGESVVLTGTDCPALDAGILRETASAMQRFDASLLPAFDGGYALLGLNHFHPSLFTAMPWSSGRVAEITLARMAQLDWRIHRHAMQHDIDEPADLQWLPPDWQAQ